MSSRLIDQNVVARLVKSLDVLVATPLAFYTIIALTKPATPEQVITAIYLAILLVTGTMLAIRTAKLYDPLNWLKPVHLTAKSALIVILSALSSYGLASLTPLPLPVSWAIWWVLLAGLYVLMSRIVISGILKKAHAAGRFHHRVAIIGGGKVAEDAIALLQKECDETLEVVGLFDDRFDNRSPESMGAHKKLGTIAELADHARANRIDLIIVAIPMAAEKRLLQILKQIWELPVDIRISAAASELKLSPSAYSYLGQLPLLNAFDRPLSGWDSFMKSCLDRLLAALLLVALSPVFAAVALAVMLDSKGPVFFRQKRFGFNNELVDVFKFRSLFVDKGDAHAKNLVTKNDPRVTRVGWIIRKTSLDELPQLINVLRGELSLVGPRPHATQAHAAGTLYEEVVEGYFARHKVKPGITGWAQINGWRGETDTFEKIQQRVKHDLEYIDRWSLGFDLYILAKTPFSLIKTENAY